MLGTDPQAVLPYATIRAAAFADEGAGTFVDRAEIMGTLSDQVQRAMLFVARNTRLGAYITGSERVEQPQFPPIAVREAIINAVLHRNYEEQSPIFLNCFPNRLEILNPGGLLPGLQAQALEGKHLLRNHTLGPLTYFGRLAETWGTGIRRMRQALTEAGLPPPELHDEGSWFRLTFYSSATAPRPAALVATPLRGGPTQPRKSGAPTGGLNARQREILAEWEQAGHGQIRRAEYQARFEIANPTAWRDLQELERQGFVRSVGRGPQVVYVYPATVSPVTDEPNAKTAPTNLADSDEAMKR